MRDLRLSLHHAIVLGIHGRAAQGPSGHQAKHEALLRAAARYARELARLERGRGGGAAPRRRAAAAMRYRDLTARDV